MEDVKKYFKENSQNTLKDNYIKACSDEVFPKLCSPITY